MSRFDDRKRAQRTREDTKWQAEVEKEDFRRRMPIEALKQISDDSNSFIVFFRRTRMT
jgi:hypothetical protein